MKVCKIIEETGQGRLIGYLFYHEKSDAYSIELSEELTVKDSPIFFEAFVERGRYTVDPEFSRRWVESRVVPRDRQNIRSILKENGLKEYDTFRLLMIAEGRCAQDECAVFPVKDIRLPMWINERLEKKLEFVQPLDAWTLLLVYRNGEIWRLDAEELLAHNMRTMNILYRPDKHRAAKKMPGGEGVEWSDGVFLTAAELYGKGQKLPLTKGELDALVKNYVVDTSEICYELDCTRQYVSKLVRENGLEEFKATSGRLFARSDVDRLKD